MILADHGLWPPCRHDCQTLIHLDKKVVAFVGDGGLQMVLADILTAIRTDSISQSWS
ncbi:thiamine pyrophosphate-dependent enzyme [Bhargavaea cecembensis]|uniref:thiamine pyrophosphate-dependent enzyme n=1 Tax=Bhargavaea cecembensis TaxID=394098 RepID=UPI002E0E1656